ncbi:hypothetical protein MMPV_008794 [Pyropia vietnamensis]
MLRRLSRTRIATAAAPLLPFTVLASGSDSGGGGGSSSSAAFQSSGGGGRGGRRPPLVARPSSLLLISRLRAVGTAAAVVWTLRWALRAATPTTPEAAAAIVGAAVAAAGAGEAYAFVHLHKTGGNSLKVGLTGWAHRNGLTLLPTCHPSRFADAPWDPTPVLVGRPRRAVPGADTVCDLSDVARHTRRAAAPTVPDLVVGHGAGALSRVLPHGAATVRLFTLLRSPLARKLSHYRHFEAGAPDGGSSAVHVRTAVAANSSSLSAAAAAAVSSPLPPAHPPLADYLLTRNRAYMTKRLAGWGGTSEVATAVAAAVIDAVPGVGRAALSAAASALVRSYFFVGTQEAYAAGACVLAAQLNGACWGGRSGAGVKRLSGARLAGTHENVRGRGGRGGNTEAAAAAAAGVWPALATAVAQVEVLDGALYALATALLEEKLRWYPECQVDG